MNYEVSREDLLAELDEALQKNTPLSNPPYKVRLSTPMDGTEFKKIREELGLKQALLAETLDIPLESIRNYEQGTKEIPGIVSKVLRLMQKDSTFYNKFMEQ